MIRWIQVHVASYFRMVIWGTSSLASGAIFALCRHKTSDERALSSGKLARVAQEESTRHLSLQHP